MQHMRQQAKFYFIIVTAAFLMFGFIMWGQGDGGNIAGAPVNAAGKVNGEIITVTQYRAALSQAYNEYRARGNKDMDDATRAAIDDQTWQTLVRNRLLAQMVKKYGISVSNAEIIQAVKTNPPQDVAMMPQFQTNGQFDPAKYRAALSNPGIDWSPVENQIREQLPVQKLQMRLLAGIVVSDAEVRQAFLDENEKVDLVFAAANSGAFPADSSKITEADITNFHASHKALFTTEEQAKLFVVQVPVVPSPADQAQAMETAKGAMEELGSGREFADVAKSLSEGPWASNGGASPGPMPAVQVRPAIRAALDQMAPGTIGAPVIDDMALHLLKLTAKTTGADGQPAYQYSEIVIKVRNGDDTNRRAREQADALVTAAKQNGLQQAAADMKLQTAGGTPYFTKDQSIPGLESSAITDYAFAAKVGKVSEPIERPNGLYVVSVTDRRKAGLQPVATVRAEIKARLLQERRMTAAKAQVETIAAGIAGGQPFATAAAAAGLEVHTAVGITRLQPLPVVGEAPALIGAAFATAPGQMTKPQALATGWGIAQVTGRTPADMTLYATQKEQVRQQLMQNRQQNVLNRWFQDIYKAAKIEDYRARGGITG